MGEVSLDLTTVTRLVEILPFWQKFQSLWPFLKVYLVFAKFWTNSGKHIYYATWQISIVVNDQILNRYTTYSSGRNGSHDSMQTTFWKEPIFIRTSLPLSLVCLHRESFQENILNVSCSVTRLGDLLDFGQLFTVLWQQLVCPNLPHS